MDFSKAYDRNEFLDFLKRDFLPDDFQVKETSLDFESTYTRKVTKLGEVESLEAIVLEVQHSGKEDPRVGLSKEAFRILAGEWAQRALVIFVPLDNAANYRFSLIEVTLEGDKETAKVYRRYSNPRRYSYKLGVGIAYYTPNKYLNEKGRVANPDDLRNRFSVEVLTKEFYQELSDWYAWAVKIVRFPNKLNDPTDDDKFNAENTIRLITRLIFVWFLKQKNLIPNELFDKVYIRENLIANFSPEDNPSLFYNAGESTFYKAILQNLFFAMLNSPITVNGNRSQSERHFCNKSEDDGNSKLMHYESHFSNPHHFIELANKQVPFLNGGLFDCLDDIENGNYTDGFSNKQEVQKALFVPDYLFFAKELIVDLSHWYDDKKKNKVKVRGLLHILKCYNFTIEENTPFDQEVSLDPELLGKVFENLLASYNPETQTTARKQTGSFYTPREIVQYMVDESLIAHLKRTVGEELEPQFRQLIQYSDDAVALTDEQRKSIMLSLYNCKILDPACGSGAFPMGMLQQMVHILNRIDPGNTMWREMMRAVAIDKTSKAYFTASDDERNEIINDIERSFDPSINRPDYARKLYLIENCIYGVDIQPIAIQISKLRFFISLVVDQNTNTDPTDNFGIRPLPNLEAKFVAANTLIGLDKKNASLFDNAEIKTKENELKVAKHKIFGAKTVRTKRKYKNIVNNLRQEIANMLYANGAVGNDEARQLASWDMFDQNASSPFFDPEWMFGVKGKFDIIIGNPPWGACLSLEEKTLYKSLYPEIDSSTPNSFAYFIGLSNRIYKSYLSFVLPDSILIKDFKKTRKLLLPKIKEIVWYENAGIPYELKQFEYVDHDVCIINVGFEFSESIIRTCYSYNRSSNVLNKSSNIALKKDFILEEFDYSYNMKANELDLSILHKCTQNEAISAFMQCHEGIHSGNIREKLFHKIYSKGYKPLFYGAGRGGDVILSYYGKRSGWFVDYRTEIINRDNKEYASLRDENIFKMPKIYITRTGNPFKAFYDMSNYASNNFFSLQFLNMTDNTEENLMYILPFINSKICQYFIRTFAAPRLGCTFVETKIIHLLKFPIPIAADSTKKYIIKKVRDIINEREIGNDICEYDEEINCIIYKLYGLTYDEILIVDPQTLITREEYEKGGHLC